MYIRYYTLCFVCLFSTVKGVDENFFTTKFPQSTVDNVANCSDYICFTSIHENWDGLSHGVEAKLGVLQDIYM